MKRRCQGGGEAHHPRHRYHQVIVFRYLQLGTAGPRRRRGNFSEMRRLEVLEKVQRQTRVRGLAPQNDP